VSPLGGPDRNLMSRYPMDNSPTVTALSTKGISDQCEMSRSIERRQQGGRGLTRAQPGWAIRQMIGEAAIAPIYSNVVDLSMSVRTV
jgi:hypothetical protein